MEVKGPGRVTSPGVSRKGKKRKSGKAAFGKVLSPGDVSAAAPASGTSPLAAVSSLLSLQELPTSSEGRSKGLARAENLFEQLNLIRHGLLAGQIPRHKLKEAAAIVTQKRGQSDDPALDGILADLELRIRVELAKLEPSAQAALYGGKHD